MSMKCVQKHFVLSKCKSIDEVDQDTPA